MISTLTLNPGNLSLAEIRSIYFDKPKIILANGFEDKVKSSCDLVQKTAYGDEAVYGINTGFGKLAQTRIDKSSLQTLQKNLILSHSTGVGERLSDEIVILILVLKLTSLAQGFSGVRFDVIKLLIDLYNNDILPIIPKQGSVGASGDLAPLAHMAQLLLGIGKARVFAKEISAKSALKKCGLIPLTLAPKEGLALINGTQVSTAITLSALFKTERLFDKAIITGAMAVEGYRGSMVPFDERIQKVRRHRGQIDVAKAFRDILSGSKIADSHKNCNKVQDPYSMRCQPQVMGAILDRLRIDSKILLDESNSVTDNPLVFSKTNSILSGGNFHAEPIAFVADGLALVIAEIGSISERRSAYLLDANLSGLPPFLIANAGLNSGLMIAHVTAAALVSENKALAHPYSVDSIPTSANQEDHVSMATASANRLINMTNNLKHILAVEMLCSSQAIDLLRPLTSSDLIEKYLKIIRANIKFITKDRAFDKDIIKAAKIISNDDILYKKWLD